MMRFNKLRHSLLLTTMLLAAIGLVNCTKVDDTLGANMIPDNQQMKAGFISLRTDINPKKYVETRLFQTDSIVSSNIESGYLGAHYNDTLGLRAAGFFSQYTNYYLVDSGYFGYRPIFDSAQIIISVESCGTDTITPQTFEVYEVISNKFLTEREDQTDTIFYLSFDPETANNGASILGEKLFTFTLGGETNGPSNTAVTMQPTLAGRDFIARLMLQPSDNYRTKNYAADYSIYSTDSLTQWFDEFMGVYIKPSEETLNTLSSNGEGTIYGLTLSSSGFAIYGRNRDKEDPTLIKDTIGMNFFFVDDLCEQGNVSINNIKHDYDRATSAAKINIADAKEPVSKELDNRPTTPRAYVSGLGGVITEIKFTPAFFETLEQEIEKENSTSNKGFRSFAFSQVLMSIYFPESQYDWESINPSGAGVLIDQMNQAPARLGLYTNYKKLTAISDYNYVYETTYETSLAYDGYINRSRGCYVMDITGHVQIMWNEYLNKKKSWDEQKAWDELTNTTIYLGPEAYSLFTPQFTILQGENTDTGSAVENNAPIRLDLSYNLVK